jgi:hypothetical protein
MTLGPAGGVTAQALNARIDATPVNKHVRDIIIPFAGAFGGRDIASGQPGTPYS